MNIYKVSRTDRVGYDEYDSFICFANSEDEARNIHPAWETNDTADTIEWRKSREEECRGTWVPQSELPTLLVQHLGGGYSDGPAIILASFNAG